MKFLAKIVLFLFIAFQFSTSLLILAGNEKRNEISLLLFDEEEEEDISEDNNNGKEIKLEFFKTILQFQLEIFQKTTSIIADSYRLTYHFTYNHQYFLPPEII